MYTFFYTFPLNFTIAINDLTHKIIGCAMQVHRILENGFQEVIYQRYLAIEMRFAGLNFEREKETKTYYSDEKVETRRVDFWLKIKL
jgi:GxxExxY protein